MPIYRFSHPKNEKKTVDIHLGMNDEHRFVDKNGVEWDRVWFVPQASVDAAIDPFNANAFVDKTGKDKGSIGDLWDRSAEMSRKRAEKRDGVDPVQESYFKKAREKRKGKPSFLELKKRAESASATL
jgi:hypothetical protein